MSVACTVCSHPLAREINERLSEGSTVRDLARQHGLKHAAIQRHKAHIGEALTEADRAKAVSALDHCTWLVTKLRSLAESAEVAPRQFLEVADKLDRSIRTYGLIRGEIQTGATVTVINQLGVSIEEAQRAVKVYQASSVDPLELERRAVDFLSQRGYRCLKEIGSAA